jgi:large subunit ribosomal protein L15
MQLNNLKREHKNRKPKQVGRGGKRGKTSGRGGKGQTARAGNKRRPQMRDIIKKLPKLRGYRFKSINVKFFPVNVGDLNVFEDGGIVSADSLLKKNLIRKTKGGLPKVKILGGGEIDIKLSILGCKVSKGAQIKIEKAGGNVK